MYRGGSPLGAPQAPPKLQKPCRDQSARVAASISCVAADISRVVADILHVVANILRVVVDKAVEEAKSCWPKEFFSLF